MIQTFNSNSLLLGTNNNKVLYAPGEAHLMTIGHTGSGKGVNALIPNLLNYAGSIICIDIKGEAAQLTADYRRSIGQDVYVIDPFDITGTGSQQGLDPLQILNHGHDGKSYNGSELPIAQSTLLAEAIIGRKASKDPFWDLSAEQLVSALILFIAFECPPPLRNINELCFLMNELRSNPNELFARFQTSGKAGIRNLESSFKMESRVFSSVVATAQSRIAPLACREAARALNNYQSFDLSALTDNRPVSLYLVMPPDMLNYQAPVLRLWIATIFRAIFQRKARPELPTIFFLDEIAQLGPIDSLR
ncbi:type IV secretory system conjugative DNA transfer family protein [Bacterioplanoides sp.]|uniref:type IV secretory system conjugative DNA transfer family protein n=1 Tax=Bacterioplanoides sp. TaxID=2066072 RepID=UPI003B5CAED3